MSRAMNVDETEKYFEAAERQRIGGSASAYSQGQEVDLSDDDLTVLVIENPDFDDLDE